MKTLATLDLAVLAGTSRGRLFRGWLAACLWIAALAQGSSEYHDRAWTRADGLPHNTVRALLQTRDGYLWAATPAGAVRFDGQTFFVLNHTAFPQMASDRCRVLAEDRGGALWIGTDAGLLRWANGTLSVFDAREGLTSPQIVSLCPGRQGGLWIGTDAGIDFLNGPLRLRFTTADGLQSGPVEALLEDDAGGLWVGMQHGLLYRSPGAARFENFNPPGVSASNDRPCLTLRADATGAVWFGNRTSLCCVNPVSHKLTVHANALPEGRLTALTFLPSGGLWCADGSLGLVRFDGGKPRNFPVRPRPGMDDAYCLVLDREGGLWIGTETDGLHCWRPQLLSVLSTRDGLAHDTTWALCESPQAGLWIGTDAGLSRWCEGRLQPVPGPDRLPNPVVRALALDAAGSLWVGTGNGLAQFRESNVTVRRFAGSDPTDADGRRWNKVRAIQPSHDGALWVAVPTGLYRVQGSQESFFDASRPGDGLPHSDVRALLETREGTLWVGTAGGGAARLVEPAPGIDRYRFAAYRAADGLSSDYVLTLHEDEEKPGVLWIGTERGLNRLSLPTSIAAPNPAAPPAPATPSSSPSLRADAKPRPQIHTFGTRQGLPSDRVNFILEDGLGRLWISHDRGIYRVRKSDLDAVAAGQSPSAPCVNYDEADGMLTRETSGERCQPAGCRTRDGRLWFAAAKGVVAIDPARVQTNAVPPPVVIEQVMADGEIVYAQGAVLAKGLADVRADWTPPEGRPAARPKFDPPFRLPPGRARSVLIRYTANSFIAPNQVRFQHRLDGRDTDWVDNGTQRTAHYTNLRPGRYRLEVVAANADGVRNRTGASLEFAVAPFFHQTLAFRLACAGSGLLVIGMLVRWRLERLRQVQVRDREQALAGERERIARELHDDLGASLQHISLLSELARRQSPDSPCLPHVDQIGQTARDSLRTLSQTIWTLEPHSASLAAVADYVGDFAQRIFAAAGVRCRVEIPATWPDAELAARERHAVLAAAKESFHNILKHAAATEVRLRFDVVDRTFRLTIEDNGCGFAAKPAPAALPNLKSSGGHGLRNLAQRLTELGGHFQCDSAPSQGTQVVLSIPLSTANHTLPAPRPPISTC